MSSSSSLKSEIAAAFSAIGHPPLAPSVLARVANLSFSLRLAPNRLAEAWDAYGITKDLDALDEGTFHGYSAWAAKDTGVKKPNIAMVVGTTWLGKRKPPPGVTPSPAPKRPANADATPKNNSSNAAARDGLSAVDGLKTPSGAVSPSSKASPGSASSTVITPPKSSANTSIKPAVAATAASVVASRTKYGERTNAGQLVTSYNPSNLPTVAELLSSLPSEEQARVTARRACVVAPHPRGKHPRMGYRHIFAPLPSRSAAMERRLIRMTDRFKEKYGMMTEEEEMAMAVDGLEGAVEEEKAGEGAVKMEEREQVEGEKFDSTLEPVGIPKQNKVLCIGRICNEVRAQWQVDRQRFRREAFVRTKRERGRNPSPPPPRAPSRAPFALVAKIEGASARKGQRSRSAKSSSPQLVGFLATRTVLLRCVRRRARVAGGSSTRRASTRDDEKRESGWVRRRRFALLGDAREPRLRTRIFHYRLCVVLCRSGTAGTNASSLTSLMPKHSIDALGGAAEKESVRFHEAGRKPFLPVEAHTGRLKRASVLLEGSRQHSLGARVKLDLRQLDETMGANDLGYSLFPGQIVAVEGTNPSGRTLRASRLLEGAPPPVDVVPAKEARDRGQAGRRDPVRSLRGQAPPPDCKQGADGDGQGQLKRKVGCEWLFANKLSQLLEEFYQEDPDLRTQFVLVPSLDDAFVEAVYPQPSFEDKAPGVKVPQSLRGAFSDLGLSYVELAGREDREGGDRNRPRRVNCAFNLCTLPINDVTLGVTSFDVLYHLSSDEAGAGLPPGTRLARLASHLVE
ncbi:hypothetical protein ACHAWF_007688 [Thalassiosira exigua]